jgi:hypothetical protein
MFMSIKTLPKVGAKYPRVFSVDPKRVINTIPLRVTMMEAAKKLGIDKADAVRISILNDLGIYEHGVNTIRLGAALSGKTPPFLKLRYGEERTVENCVSAIVGRIAHENVFGPLDIRAIAASSQLSLDEKAAITGVYLGQFEFYETDFLVEHASELILRAFPFTANMPLKEINDRHEEFIVQLARKLFVSDMDRKATFMTRLKMKLEVVAQKSAS